VAAKLGEGKTRLYPAFQKRFQRFCVFVFMRFQLNFSH